jgi:3-hydroxyisobutyrate dehydrogenase
MTLRIGFIGLGVMGTPMTGHLARAGFALTLLDLDAAKAERLAAEHAGVRVAATPREVAAASEIVVTMLPDGQHVQDVALGEAGLIHGFGEGGLLLDTSSSEPWLTLETAARLASCGVGMVDAPTSGARMGAEAATLVFMVGGEQRAVSRVRPLLDVMGRQVFHLGAVGAGHMMKSINNLITALTFMATAECLTLGKKLGLDPDVMTDVLNVSTGMSWITQKHVKQRIINRAFDDPFKLELMVKDIRIAMQLAAEQGLEMPLSSHGQALWKAAGAAAGAGASVSEMARWVEQRAGVAIEP